MPLLAAATSVDLEPPSPRPEPLPPTLPPPAPYLTWTPTGGPELILSRSARSGILLGGVNEAPGIIGMDMPPEERVEAELAAGDGALLIGRRAPTREVGLPVVIHADTLEELEAARREMSASFNPRRGDGVLKWALPDGSPRMLTCRYSGGLDSSAEGRLGGGQYYNSYIIQLRAIDPYWYGEEVRLQFTPPSGVDFFGGGDGATPFMISQSDTFGVQRISIDGEVEVFPDWELVGPCTTATLRHEATGREMELTPNLAEGETLTVRTDPRVVAARKFTREDGSNAWGQVAGDFPSLWPLQPGTQQITVFAAGTVAGTSLVRLRYRPRYLTA